MLLHRVLCVAAVAVTALGGAPGAGAHETAQFGGHELVVGWADEPTYVGVRNAVQVSVYESVGEDGERGDPVEGLEDRLRVEVTLGEESTGSLAMRSVFDSPGEYRADLTPTRPGAYTFHLTGEIDGEPIDESFSPPGFDEVRSGTEIEFPDDAPSRAELADAVERMQRTEPAQDESDGVARLLGAGGLALGALALIGVAVSRARRAGGPS